ncbi:MAG: hypothetical protein Q9191_003709 [Dirinaria sp. TL-2023a]
MAAESSFTPGKVDEILRRLGPKNVEVPPAPEKAPAPLQTVQGGGIDEILAKLKPKPSSKPIDTITLKIPCKHCQRFDLALMDEGYADDHDMCPTCRKETLETQLRELGRGSVIPQTVSTTASLRKRVDQMMLPAGPSPEPGSKAALARKYDKAIASRTISTEQRKLGKALEKAKEALAELERKKEAKSGKEGSKELAE